MVMHPHIEVKSSVISGHGMYVVKPIAKGEVLWHEEEDESKYVVHEDVVQTWPEDVRKKFYNFAYQVGEGLWSGEPARAPRAGAPLERDPHVLAARLQACPRAWRATAPST